MLSQHAIFVDAGYLLSQAITIASGKASKHRKDLDIKDPPGLLAFLKAEAKRFSPGSRLLRTYWYDGVGASMTHEQITIAGLPDLHFRGGSLHNKKQKGVDSRIVQDLFELASERTICDAIIVTGDGDLSVGIEFAQRRGVRIAILGVEDIPNGVSPSRHAELNYLADRLLTMGNAEINRFFAYQPVPTVTTAPTPTATVPPPAATTVTPGPIAPLPVPQPSVSTASPTIPPTLPTLATYQQIVDTVVATILPENLPGTLNAAGGIIQELDRQLLLEGKLTLGRKLEDTERNDLRAVYRARVRQP